MAGRGGRGSAGKESRTVAVARAFWGRSERKGSGSVKAKGPQSRRGWEWLGAAAVACEGVREPGVGGQESRTAAVT